MGEVAFPFICEIAAVTPGSLAKNEMPERLRIHFMKMRPQPTLVDYSFPLSTNFFSITELSLFSYNRSIISMNKTMRILFFLLLISTTAAGYSQASATATASVTILKPISITKEADMNFAEIITSESAGTVTLFPSGSRTVSGGAAFPVQTTQTAQAASFKIQGENAAFSVSLPQEIYLSDGIRTLQVDNFTYDSTGILEDGIATVNIGATLHVNGMQEAGVYQNSGDMRITVQYE